MDRSVVIHVSGTPGSGKTYLGNFLEGKFPDYIKHIDTDTLSYDSFTKDSKILKVIEEYGKTKIILLCGTVYMGKDVGYKIKTRNFSKFEWATRPKIKKYFIEISPKKLLKQYYTRLVSEYKSKDEKQKEEFWSDLVNNNDEICSNYGKVVQGEDDLYWHSENNYLVLSQEKIINEIIEYIKSIK